jgi:hypothetical protein
VANPKADRQANAYDSQNDEADFAFHGRLPCAATLILASRISGASVA